MAQSNEELVHRYLDAHRRHAYDEVGTMRHPDWTVVWPQSGERIRGHANDQAIMANWPGGLPEAGDVRVIGAEDRYVISPAFTIERIVGSGDTWFADGTASYPDGTAWFAAAIVELRDGRVLRETWYFAPPLEAPAWRSQWVERVG
jgi:ketosteroid isomerase-like protein